jgi:predicted small metal-binding protein
MPGWPSQPSSPSKETDVKTRLDCPCGEHISAEDEDALVRAVQEHLRAAHPDHEYTREQILMMAY